MIFIKNYYYIIVILIFSIIIINIANVNGKSSPLDGKIIFVDAGHGGRDPGTRYGNILEKDLNLVISNVIRNELEKSGAKVIMARDSDIDLSKEYDYNKKHGDLNRRINKMKNNNCDLYISIHLNWYNDYYYGGAEVLYNQNNLNNKLFAEKLTKSLEKYNIRTRDIKKTNLYMYRNATIPGVLFECGFLSNKNDRYLLQTKKYQLKLAKAIVDSMIDYFMVQND